MSVLAQTGLPVSCSIIFLFAVLVTLDALVRWRREQARRARVWDNHMANLAAETDRHLRERDRGTL